MIQILKDYYWAFRSIFHQRSEIREYLDRYVPDHADMFTPLRQFKNKHIGQRCFIVATGPSLTIEDVSKLKNEICWSMNSGLLCYCRWHSLSTSKRRTCWSQNASYILQRKGYKVGY